MALLEEQGLALGRREKSALDRARWLAELAEALGSARDILEKLGRSSSDGALEQHVTRAIAEVETLRRRANWRIGDKAGPGSKDVFRAP